MLHGSASRCLCAWRVDFCDGRSELVVVRTQSLAVLLIALSMTQCAAGGEHRASATAAIDYIRRAVREAPIVCLAEGGHQAREPHLFFRRVLADTSVLAELDVIIVEFAAGQHQAVLDAYIRGEDVPFATLSKVWRDTGQSPRAPWDSPLYQELLEVIRDGNRDLPADNKVRVLAGDPAMDWEQLQTRADYSAARVARDPYVAELAIEHAFEHDKRVLILFGGAHLPRVPLGPQDPRNSMTYRILCQHPEAVTAIGFLDPVNLGVEDRIAELEPGMIYSTDRHWAGEIGGELMFPGIISLITVKDTGEKQWRQVPLYPEYRVRDLFDALVYIGPTSAWGHVPSSFDEERDAAYLAELNRRSLLRFGRPLRSGR